MIANRWEPREPGMRSTIIFCDFRVEVCKDLDDCLALFRNLEQFFYLYLLMIRSYCDSHLRQFRNDESVISLMQLFDFRKHRFSCSLRFIVRDKAMDVAAEHYHIQRHTSSNFSREEALKRCFGLLINPVGPFLSLKGCLLTKLSL